MKLNTPILLTIILIVEILVLKSMESLMLFILYGLYRLAIGVIKEN